MSTMTVLDEDRRAARAVVAWARAAGVEPTPEELAAAAGAAEAAWSGGAAGRAGTKPRRQGRPLKDLAAAARRSVRDARWRLYVNGPKAEARRQEIQRQLERNEDELHSYDYSDPELRKLGRLPEDIQAESAALAEELARLNE